VTHLPDHMLFVMLAVLFPLRAATFGYRRLSTADEADVPRVRMWLYRQVMAIQWSLVALAILIWLVFRRPWGALGLHFEPNSRLIGVAVGVVVSALLIVLRERTDQEGAAERARERVRHLERMLPHDARELRWFAAVAVTAGVCEELLYRGFLLWYLQNWVPIAPAIAAAAIIFGAGHFYQGARGMIMTGVVGAFLAAVYVLTGSLYASMVIHALMDLHAGRTGLRLFGPQGA
jgi:membrane protease YdiL (CAAX protease family)